METLISIKTLTKQTGLTVRTLRHYDAIGLLKPSGSTSGGHRLYSEQDLLRLQQILFLKQMGFKLNEIKEMLEHQQWNWQDCLDEQLRNIQAQQARLSEMEAWIKSLKYSIEVEGEVKWQVIYEILQNARQDRDHAHYRRFIDEYFEPHERELLDKIPSTNNDTIHTWLEIEQRLRSLTCEDPADQQVQEVIQQFVNVVRMLIGNDEAFLDKLWRIRKNPDLSRRMHFYPMDQKLADFMDQALEIYYERNQQ